MHAYSFDLSREVVAVSLDLFDRYMASRGNECSGNLALLVSLTTLHVACKLHNHEAKKIKIETLASLSRGQFGPKHIEEMELKVLQSLGWRLHPPTLYSFVSHIMLLLPLEAHASVRKEMFELSRYLTELAVCDTYFVNVKKSTVAYASILNVMDEMSYSRLSAGIRARFLRDLAEKLGFSYADPAVMAARGRLRAMFSSSGAPSSDAAPAEVKSMDDGASLASSTMSSTGSLNKRTGARSRSSSMDSKGSCRYAASPHRPFMMAGASPVSRATKLSCSPVVASVQ
jgi:lipoyl(octanoyl) transferase